MLRSLMTAVTGVRAHQTMLDVTGNNIANANTTGFKKDNTIFADLMYQASKYASASTGDRGGINPAQVGLGVSVAAIETIHTQGSGSFTGNNSDMMIQDKGFFVYSDGGAQLFSRSGACVLDNNSNMVQAGTGYRLQGYQMELQPATGEYEQAAELSDVRIPIGEKIDAHATSRVDYQCNLNSESKAYLPYGFADIPYNAVAGWKGNSNGTAVVKMDGADYEFSFNTNGLDVNASTLQTGGAGYNAEGTGAFEYLHIDIKNGGVTTRVGFDLVGIENGLPKLRLPTITYAEPAGGGAGTWTYPTAGTGDLTFVGILDDKNNLYDAVPTSTLGNTITETDQNVLNSYTPVYRFPGSTPPKYFTIKYDESTGDMQFRSLSFMQGSTDVTSKTTTAGLVTDLNTDPPAGIRGATIVPGASVFTYNINDNMKYTNFTLKGAPTIPNTTNGNAVEPTNLEYDFVVEFDERAVTTGSDASKRASKVTLWYYGYSNADATNTTYNGGTETEKMHKLTATVFFNPDGSFESVVWDDTTNANAPLGYRIVDDTVGSYTTPANSSPNFQIAVGNSSSASSVTDTLNFQQAKSLDNPGADWSTMGTTYQGGFHATKTTIYDDNGKTHTLEVTFKKLTENRWRWEAFLVQKNEETGEDELENIIPEPRSGEIEFDGSGRISNAISDSSDSQRRGDGNDAFPNAEVEITLPFSLNGQPNSVVTLNFGGGVGKGGSALEGVTQFASETTTKPIYQDGYTMGVLKNYSIASNGLVTGSYDNGVNLPIYRVALATFVNEQGLEKVGNTMFRATVNSGVANIDGAETNGKGSIMSQYVEMSNVDLTEEFTHLIIAQRGFQANARTVTVSDQILEEVVNLKR